uniref:PDZ domain-containing protein n=1 Tax=Meloidogyne javanica TaxID=6303 RepID=A0A915LJ55_MELJA
SPTHSPMQTATVSAWTPCSSRSLSPCASPAASLRGSWSYDIVFLPSHLERHIKILKSSLPLGVVLDADADKAINGCVAKNICSKKALAKDGRIQPGDFIVKINGENLRNVTNAQARAILKRANLIGAHISYITASDARLWKDRFHRLDSVSMFPTDDSIQQIRSAQQNVHTRGPSIPNSELHSPNNDEHQYLLPSTSQIFEENVEKSRKEELTSQLNFERFVDNLQKVDLFKILSIIIASFGTAFLNGTEAIIADAIFDLYIIWSRDKQNILHSNIAASAAEPSLSSPSSSVSLPKTIKSPLRALRAASIAVSQPPPKPQKGILRRAASSFKKFSVRFSRGIYDFYSISIVGGRVEVSQKGIEMATTSTLGSSSSPALSSTVSGIFIKSVIADSPAGRCGKLFMGDRLLKVNEIDLLNTTHESAVQAIKNASNPVCFVVQSLQSLQTFVAREKEVGRDLLKEYFQNIEGQTSLSIPPSPAIVEIDSASAAALEKDAEDEEVEDIFHYTKRKVLKKYSDLPGKPVLIRMPNIPPGGLGLILSTRRDEGANRPPVIVVGVKSDSPLSLKVGDELLEINGLVLFGLSHLEATEKIRKCCQHSSLSLLVLRKEEETTKEVQQPSLVKESTSTTTIETVVNTNADNAPISPEKEYTSESECELGAKTIVSEILARQQQQQMPEVKIEPPEDGCSQSAKDVLLPGTTMQNDSGSSNNEPICESFILF